LSFELATRTAFGSICAFRYLKALMMMQQKQQEEDNCRRLLQNNLKSMDDRCRKAGRPKKNALIYLFL
jgi:hypothetical protein